MKKKWILFILIPFLFTGCGGGSVDVEEDGDRILISSSKTEVLAEKVLESTETYLFWGETKLTPPEKYQHIFMAGKIMPIYRAETLIKHYGKFTVPGSKGAQKADEVVDTMYLVGRDGEVEETLQQIRGLMQKGQRPVAKMTLKEIIVFQFTYKNDPVNMPKDMQTHYLVESIEIIQNDLKITG